MQKLYIAASVCMPVVLLFNLYNRQSDAVHVIFTHILILAAILSLAGLVMLLVLKRFVSAESSIILMTLFWLCFWFFGSIRRHVFTNMSGTVLILLIAAALTFILVLLIKFKPPLKDFSPAFGTLCAVFVIMFLVNAMPAFYRNIFATLGSEAEILDNPSTRRSFHVNNDLPMPDIYWIHLDGMISLETFEYFFGICQENTRNELASRGFLIYRNAHIRNASNTFVALPMLLSPSVHDNIFSPVLDNMEESFAHEIREELFPILEASGICRYDDIYANLELLVSLLYRGYRVNGFNTWWGWNILDSELLFTEDQRGVLIRTWDSFTKSDLPFLLSETTPIPTGWIIIGNDTYQDVEYRLLPRAYRRADFTWIYYDYTHVAAWRTLIPSYSGRALTRIDLYPLAYETITTAMFKSIDEIRQRNPNAVIILQSDHGIHAKDTQLYLEYIGVPRETLHLLFHSVFSAVHIPEVYGGLSEPIHPLNIARVLVNRYVGENYRLLDMN